MSPGDIISGRAAPPQKPATLRGLLKGKVADAEIGQLDQGGVTVYQLPELTNEDLRDDYGIIKTGARKAILKAAKEI